MQSNRWMFEKYDGIRGFRNPKKRAFYSRLGNKFEIPQDIIAPMPDIFLDGELWYCKIDLLAQSLTFLFQVRSELFPGSS